uniref:Uncharacterized protein n=1 Tax=Oryza rufipogon TaxID=4529 RepID=A0A0E0RFJ5_ORYRU
MEMAFSLSLFQQPPTMEPPTTSPSSASTVLVSRRSPSLTPAPSAASATASSRLLPALEEGAGAPALRRADVERERGLDILVNLGQGRTGSTSRWRRLEKVVVAMAEAEAEEDKGVGEEGRGLEGTGGTARARQRWHRLQRQDEQSRHRDQRAAARSQPLRQLHCSWP